MKKLPIIAFAAAAVIGCGKETPAETTDDGINPPPLPDETNVCSGIEDEEFRKCCLTYFDTDGDGKISRREAELVKEINSDRDDWRFDIKSFKGIEYFSNLETLFCPNLGVETIDLHYNAKFTTIPEYAFADCYELKKIVLPPNVTSIGEHAFEGNEKLAGFDGNLASADKRFLILDGKLVGFAPAGLTVCSIPDGVKEIGAGTIGHLDSGLTEIRIPDSVTSVAEGAISELEDLKAIHSQFATDDHRCLIMDGKLLAFASAGLTEYSIPKRIKAIGKEAFSYCGLTGITIPDGVETIGESAFYFSSLTSVNIPYGVKTIGSQAFFGCDGLAAVTIPDSATSIGDRAFFCNLESVTVEATTPPALGYRVFGNVGNEYNARKLEINVPKSAVDAYRTAEGWKEYAECIRGM